MIKLIVCDFDGTLADTKKIVEKSIIHSIEKFGFKINENFSKALGNAPLKQLLHFIIRNNTAQEFFEEKIHKISKEYIREEEKYVKKVKLTPHLKSLGDLPQKKIILSNNASSFIKKVIDNSKIRFFDRIYGSDKFGRKYDAFQKIMRKYSVKPYEIIYLGDRPIDVKVGREVGCVSVIISHRASWSSRKEVIAAEPDFLIKDIRDLKRVIKQIDKG